MSTDEQDKHEVDRLLKRVLRDDLPCELESKMKERLAVSRRVMGSPEDARAVRTAGLWRRFPVFLHWLPSYRVSQKEMLACVSALMLAAGAVIHLGGFRNALADSISLLKTSMLVTDQMLLADSMDCVVNIPAAGRPVVVYRIHWVRDGGTRLDIESAGGIDETFRMNQARLTPADSQANRPVPLVNSGRSLQEPVVALLSPENLASRLDNTWRLQPGARGQKPDTLVFVDRRDRLVVEIRFDRNSLLPVRLNWGPVGADSQSEAGGLAGTAEFTWSRQMVPNAAFPLFRLER